MAKRFKTTVPRYVGGKYVDASVERPAVVEFSDKIIVKLVENKDDPRYGKPVDLTLIPIDDPDPEKPKAYFHDVRRTTQSAAARDKVMPPGKRVSDVDPV